MKLNLKSIPATALAATIMATAMASSGIAHASTEFKYASSAPPNSPWAKLIHAYAGKVAKTTGGEVTIKSFLGSQLGNEQVAIQKVARGRIDAGGFSLTGASLVVPELGLLAAPYLWDNLAQAECALDNHLNTNLQPYFNKHNLVFVGWGETGYQKVFARKPMTNVSDFKGAKLRSAPSKSSVLGWKALGANGVVLPVTEINSAFQTKLVEAGEAPAVYGILTGISKLAPQITHTNHIYLPSLTLLSKKSFDKLPEAQQAIMLKSGLPVAVQRGTLRKVEAALMQKFAAAGGVSHHLSDAQMAEFKATMSATHEKLVSISGDDATEVWKLIQDAKTACSAN